MKRLKSIILGAFFASSAFAQAPSPTQIGTLKTTNPYPVSILYNNTWYPMGSVNTTLNIFTLPVGNLVNGTTPFLTATNTFTNLQTYSSGIAIGGSTGVISIKNPSASVAYNFNLPATSGSANAPLLSGGGSSSPMTWGTRSGSTTAFATVSGSLTGGNCVSIDSSGNLVDAGGPCSTGGGGGTVSSGHTGELAFYAATGTTVTGNTNAIMTTGKLTLGIAGSSQGSLALSGSTSGTTTLAAPTTASGTMTLPAATDTIVGKNTTDIFTNKTIDTAGPNTIRVNGTSLTSVTGTGNVVLSTSPTFVTPILGTPTSATLTNATGLPVSTGLAGAGTGVATALGIATNTANGLLTLDSGATVPVSRGGTGIASGTSGAIPYFSSTSAIASSALLTQYGVMYGGGPGAAPATTAAGTSGYVLSGNGASFAPTFNSLTSLLDSNFSSAQGSILYRGSSGWASLAPGTSGQFLKTQGASANPVWATATGGASYVPGVDAVSTCGVDNTGATDTTSALNTCLSTYKNVSLRAGQYLVSACINVPSYGSLVGANMGPAYVGVGNGGTVISSNSTTANVICAGSTKNVYLMNFTVDRTVVPIAGAGVYMHPNAGQATIYNVLVQNNWNGFSFSSTDFSLCSFCIAQNNYNNGFYFPITAGNLTGLQWILQNTLSQTNNNYGYYIDATASTSGGSPWMNAISFANRQGGFVYVASAGQNINDMLLVSPTSSADCNNGIYLSLGSGTQNSIVGGLVELTGQLGCGRNAASPATNTGNGITIANALNLDISHLAIGGSSYHGIYSTNGVATGTIQLTNNIIATNGRASTGTYSGIAVSGSGKYIISNNNVSDFGLFQKYGISMAAGPSAYVSGNDASSFAAGGAGCSISSTAQVKPTVGSFSQVYNFGTGCP